MKHGGEAALDTIEPMLIELRKVEGIRERNPGVFYKKSLAFIHSLQRPTTTSCWPVSVWVLG
jgi:hypothetical protein